MNQLRKTNCIAGVLSALAFTFLLLPSAPAPAASPVNIYIVTSTADSGAGTLRYAINQANTHPGADLIHFDIPGCVGICTIAPLTPLPVLIDGGTTIDGYTQPGAAPATGWNPATIVIEIDGVNLDPNNLLSSGLNIASAGNLVRGLAIIRCPIHGITIGYAKAAANLIQGNHIGVTPSAGLTMGNLRDGVFIGSGAASNLIGGDTPAERNIIGGNGWDGVGIHGSGSNQNEVRGNFIGINGVDPMGNALSGVHIYGGAQDNIVGGFDLVEGNLITGNRLHGVNIAGAGTDGNVVATNDIGNFLSVTPIGNSGDGVRISAGAQHNSVEHANKISANLENGVQITGTNTLSNTISGNYIGAAFVELPEMGNAKAGVLIGGGAGSTLVGGDRDAGEGNLISGNETGVSIEGSDTANNVVAGNRIGVDFHDTSTLGNTNYGVRIANGAHNNRIGGENSFPGGVCIGECNLVSGNGLYGIMIRDALSISNTISGNYIGTDSAGALPIPNSIGVRLIRASYTTIGGDTPGERNLISGNIYHGIEFLGITDHNVVTGNYIGTDASGTSALANGLTGIQITEGMYNQIGGEAAGQGNLISGNGSSGVYLSALDLRGEVNTLTENNTVSGNIIGLNASGTSALGNGGSGVLISGGGSHLIGGETALGGNTISGNAENGVEIKGGSAGNLLRFNRIGVSLNEMVALGNGSHGVLVDEGSQGNIIGGAGDTGGNLISGNLGDGVRIQGTGTRLNQVLGNLIGSQPYTFSDLGNALFGVHIHEGASENTIAGHNVIAYNTNGVLLDDEGTMENTVSASWIIESDFNGIYIGGGAKANTIGPENLIRSNAADGVWIGGVETFANVVTLNAIGDNDQDGIDLLGGANHDIQPPTIDAVGSSLTVEISGSACAGCIVEVFGNVSADGEGQIYIDSVVAEADGSWSLSAQRLFYPYLTATATRVMDGTSEFSAPVANPYRYVFMPMVVR